MDPARHLYSHTTEEPVRILVVDDSVVMRQLITRMLASEPMLEVVGAAKNGLDALAKIDQYHPDLVTLDIEMPELDGIGALRLIQERFPGVRVIMCSSLTTRGAAVTIDALLTGADDYVTKQMSDSMSSGAYDLFKADLITKIRSIFHLSVVDGQPASSAILSPYRVSPTKTIGFTIPSKVLLPEILAIGVSTGGPAALAELLPAIPADFPLPIVIVQHMPPLFTQLLADRLGKISRIEVCEATSGMEVRAGRAILAAGDFHMRLMRRPAGVAVELNQEPHENSCRPAVDVLFRSAAQVYAGNVIAVILTGMGHDGLSGVRQLKHLGAAVVAQDNETSVVWGMPGAVANANLADEVLPIREIVPAILRRIG